MQSSHALRFRASRRSPVLTIAIVCALLFTVASLFYWRATREVPPSYDNSGPQPNSPPQPAL